MSDVESFKLTRKAVENTAAAVRRVKTETTSRDLSDPGPPHSTSGTSINWQRGRNGASATIPAWSCVAIGSITGGSSSAYPGDGYCASLTKPAGTAGIQYGLTGLNDCPANGPSGKPSLCSFHLEAGWATYDTGTPVPGMIYGPKSGQFTLSAGYPGYVVIAVVDPARKLILVMPYVGKILGKLSSSLSQGGSATVVIWTGPPNSETASSISVTAYDWLMKAGATAIASGKKVVCEAINGFLYVTEAECA